MRSAGRFALLALALAACSGEPTRLLVVVRSETDVASVRVRASDPEREILLGSGASLPLSFVVVPRGGDASRPVSLEVQGLDGSGSVVVARSVRSGFRAGRTLVLEIVLEAACRAHAGCPAERTCIGGACASDLVDPADLAEVEPGRELERDASTPLDAPGPADAAIDHADAPGAIPIDCAEVASSGAHTIDPDGEGGAAPFQALCDASTDGGGWALIAKVSATGAQLAHGAPDWTGPDAPFGDDSIDSIEDSLRPAYWRLPVDELRIELRDAGGTRADRAPLDVTAPITLRDAMDQGTPILLARARWEALAGVTLPAGECIESAVGASMRDGRVRIGLLVSEDAPCDASASAVAWIGVGGEGDERGPCTATTIHAGGAAFCAMMLTERPADALVWGRSRPGG